MAKSANILQIKYLNFKYDKDSKFNLRNINLSFEKGKIYAILGQNGSGKSTLLNCISNINKSYDGEIIYKNTLIRDLKDKERAKIISHIPQLNIGNSLSVYDSVLLGRKPYINITPSMVDYEATSHAVDMFNLNHLSLKMTSDLSGGELQSVSIARAFAQNTPIMLMDEPTNNLDVKKQHELFFILKKITKDKDKCIICVIHDLKLAKNYADEFIFMKNGQVIKTGNKSIIKNDLIEDVFEVPAKLI